MIDNVNASKNAPSGDFVEYEKYVGVASISVKAINPNNAVLRNYGWTIPEDAAEPVYILTKERNGVQVETTKIRFLVQIHDLEGKPIVPIDFFINKNTAKSDKGKFKIIDSFGRTAWATGDEARAHKIPQYTNGPASISSDYRPCHPGQEELVKFIAKLLNITPLQIFDRKTGSFVESKNPGHITIDHWDTLCTGDVTELADFVSLQPDNRVKIILGVMTNPDNKTYQTFLNTTFIGNGASVDRNTGEYATARKAIDKFMEGRNPESAYTYTYSALPVQVWKNSASDVTDNSSDFDDANSTIVDSNEDDLPF